MALPSEVKVLKGSKQGVAVAATLPGRTNLKPKEVALRVTHSGVCGTDLHHIHDDMVLGHEGVGKVEAVGEAVTKFKVGDRVGFGYVKDGCGQCDTCNAGNYFYCKIASRQYGATDHDQGSFSNFAVWPETNLHKIPDPIADAQAAPLLCAGVTVFTPMIRHGMKPGHRVGILGIGGLGHLAIQFAAKLGAHVVVFSGSESKKDEALRLGAKEFWLSGDLKTKKPDLKLDYLITTATKLPDWEVFLEQMAPFGHIILLGLTTEPLHVPYFPFILKEISIHGALSSTPTEFDAMLDFAAKFDVKAVVEEFPMTEEGAAKAIGKLNDGSIRYRAVLVT
ncbi:chaperonin 10-like protein [Paraphoma chrysanthemicola]|uniref:Chaperonin 10-like protein n=1 Tax=Paraphoma chrysanthemicola TaxID=798071 RepID=A0A8K0VZ40_9PLEO|nr:chaperonin 10-like protein [Paraphoma chrysanthemicola]